MTAIAKGQRVVVTADLDYGEQGVVIAVEPGQYRVRLDRYPDTPYVFERDEVEATGASHAA